MEIQGGFMLPNTQETKVLSEPKGLFDQDTFLKLLVAQLQNPSPFEPPEVDRMMEQAVQFGIIERLLNVEREAHMARAADMIGREVVVAHAEKFVTGVVERVILEGSKANIVIDGKQYDMGAVVEVRGPAAVNPAPEEPVDEPDTGGE